MRALKWALLAAVVCVPWLVGPALAAGPREQRTPAITYHPDRQDYLVVWVEDRGRGADIYAKRLFGNGLPKGGPSKGGYQVIRASGLVDNHGERIDPSLVFNPDTDEFLLVYSEYVDPDNGYDVFSVRLSAAGYSRTKPRRLAGGPGDQQHPDVALIAAEGGGGGARRDFIVVWDDNTRDIDEVWALRLRFNGIPSGRPYVLVRNDGIGANARDPAASGAVVAWVDDRNGQDEIWALRLRNGLPNGTEYRLVRTAGPAFAPRYGAGQLLYNTFDFNTGVDIVGVQVYATGTTRGGSFGILVPAADQAWPDLDRGVVVFSDNRSGEYDLYGVRLSTDNGRRRGREFVVFSDRVP